MNKLMANLVTNVRAKRTVLAALLLGVLAIALAAPAVPLVAATAAANAAASAVATAAAPAAATGFGFWAALGCMGCVGGFVIGGGLTVIGLAVVLAANPELGIACVASCAAAY
jgi:hypothetical protein